MVSLEWRVELPNRPSGGTMQTPQSRLNSEDEEKIVAKKLYSAPTLVELDGSRTELGTAPLGDGSGGSDPISG